MWLRRFVMLLILLVTGQTLLAQNQTDEYYLLEQDMSIYELSQQFNICIEEFIKKGLYVSEYGRVYAGTNIWMPRDVPPCYDEQGHRLNYYDEYGRLLDEPVRLPLRVHAIRSGDTWETITRQYNVCVADILKYNPSHMVHLWREIFIPDDAPECYDSDTGTKWIYTDDTGKHRIPSRLSSYYAPFRTQNTLLQVSHELNICVDELTRRNPETSPYSSVTGDILYPPDAPDCYIKHMPSYIQERGNTPENSVTPVMMATATPLPPDNVAFVPTPQPTAPAPTANVYGRKLDSPLEISQKYNVCLEELAPINTNLRKNGNAWQIMDYAMPVYVPVDYRPCYDEQGRRLRYSVSQREGNQPEYSDLAVYITNQYDRLEPLAKEWNVCPDAITFENRLNSDLVADMELFIPDSRPCYDENGQKLVYEDSDGQPLETPYAPALRTTFIADTNTTVLTFSHQHNRCIADILEVNPGLEAQLKDGYITRFNRIYHPGYSYVAGIPFSFATEIFIPDDRDCYSMLQIQDTEDSPKTLAELEARYNICAEELIQVNKNLAASYSRAYQAIALTHLRPNQSIYLPEDAPPCYDEQGNRLRYQIDGILWKGAPSDLETYMIEKGDRFYHISKNTNVCIPDLLAENPHLAVTLFEGQTVFLPEDARPCYDPETGHTLLYEDEEGNLLDTPVVADGVLYEVQSGDLLMTIAQRFNVCYNRIAEANGMMDELYSRDEKDNFSWRMGTNMQAGQMLVIPVERPACYDENGRIQYYVCYSQEVDLTKDYSESNLTFDKTGSYCYPLYGDATPVWYEGKSYLLRYTDYDFTFQTRKPFYVHYSWAYDVPIEAIADATENVLPEMGLVGSPGRHVLIPCAPDERCYRLASGEEVRDDYSIYTVRYDDTLSKISYRYGKLPQWIADANAMPDVNYIYAGQQLIVPAGLNLWDMSYFAMGGGMFVMFSGIATLLWRRRQRPTRKRKNEDA